jgi:hypothetical protein
MTKIQAMKELEKAGMSFTANVIMNGCGKPTKKMQTLVELIRAGHDVRHAQFDCYTVIINGADVTLGHLDSGAEAVLRVVQIKREGWAS